MYVESLSHPFFPFRTNADIDSIKSRKPELFGPLGIPAMKTARKATGTAWAGWMFAGPYQYHCNGSFMRRCDRRIRLGPVSQIVI